MDTKGLVKKIKDDKAYVEIIRKTSCESCSSCENKNSCHSAILLFENARNLVIEAQNKINAKVGDKVTIEAVGNQNSLLFAAMIFILPIIIAIVTFVLIENFVKTVYVPYIVSFALFIISFLLFAKVADKICKKQVVYIVREIEN